MVRKPTIQDVAALAGVAPSTVSRVLNNHPSVSEQTRRSVRSAVSQLGYTPNTMAQGLRTRKSYLVGLVVPDISNPFYPEFARGLEDVASDENYSVLIVSTDGVQSREIGALRRLHPHVDGIVSFPSTMTGDDVVAELGPNYPFVMCDARDVPDTMNVVRTDDRRGAELATQHLMSLGCRRIAFLSVNVNAHEARLAGYVNALQQAGQSADPAWQTILPDYHIESRIIDDLKAHRIDGIVCVNDALALQLIRRLYEAGIHVPQHLCIVGFDNVEAGTTNIPSLSTVDYDKYKMGREAGQLLFRLIDADVRPQATLRHMPPRLIVRESSTNVF